MRTTLDLPKELIEWLRKEAARRGERGYSGIVKQALQRYRSGPDSADVEERRRLFDSLRLTKSEAASLDDHLELERKSWGDR